MRWIFVSRVPHFSRVLCARNGIFISLVVLLSLVSHSLTASEGPQDILAAGRVDEAIKSLQEKISSFPTAESNNLLCRAYFELNAWDAGIPYCEKAVAL